MLTISSTRELLTDPAIRLLRKQNAAAVIVFLQETYNDIIALSEEQICDKLSIFLEEYEMYVIDSEITDVSKIIDFRDKALKYIRHWAGKDCRFLTDSRNDKGETEYRLTRHTMRVFQWVGDLEARDFVGTRSRLEDIFRKLQDIVTNSSNDRNERIEALKRQRNEIDEQIRRIEKGEDTSYDKSRLIEEIQGLNDIVRRLSLDFREVQENFRVLAANIRMQALNQASKGETLGFALDALEELQDTEQGKSFYGFFEMLSDPRRRELLNALVDLFYARLDERGVSYPAHRPLENLPFDLHREAREVYEYNRAFSERLAKVIATKNLTERKRALQIIQEIKSVAVTAEAHNIFWYISDSKADLPASERYIPIDLLTRQEANRWLVPDLRTTTELPDLTSVFEAYQIDIQDLEDRINALLLEQEQISLFEIVTIFPIQKGLYEVIAYLDIATRYAHHFIDHQQSREAYHAISFATEPPKFLLVPNIIYHRP